MVQRNFHMGLSPHHVLIFLEMGGVCKRQTSKNVTRVEGCKNYTYHGNGEKMWNVNGNVNRIVGAKKLK